MLDEMMIKKFLNEQYEYFNALEFLHCHPDPLNIVHKYKDFKHISELAFICALYSYGNAKMIVKNLENMPFELLLDTAAIIHTAQKHFPYYRFQSSEDTKECFLCMAEIIKIGGLKSVFLRQYKKYNDIQQALLATQQFLQRHIRNKSKGLNFLFGRSNAQSPLKRYNMFLRWMVRKDALDLGLWQEIAPSALLIPLDTHTFRIAKLLGLCKSSSCSIKAVREITSFLRQCDPKDPIKYDFALYRIGQLKYNVLANIQLIE